MKEEENTGRRDFVPLCWFALEFEFARANKYEIRDIQIKRNKMMEEVASIMLTLRSGVKKTHAVMIQEWESIKGISFIEEIE